MEKHGLDLVNDKAMDVGHLRLYVWSTMDEIATKIRIVKQNHKPRKR